MNDVQFSTELSLQTSNVKRLGLLTIRPLHTRLQLPLIGFSHARGEFLLFGPLQTNEVY